MAGAKPNQRPGNHNGTKTIIHASDQRHSRPQTSARAFGTVGDYLQRAAAAGLGWPLPAELSETQLQEKLLGGVAPPVAHPATKAVPD
jgi:hypothetical protein